MRRIDGIIAKYLDTGRLSKEEIEFLLGLEDEADLQRLFSLANEVRERSVGNEVHLRGIIEFSNYCSRACLYCGISRHNRHLSRYRMDVEEILEAAKEAVGMGFKTIVLQSGEDPFYSTSTITRLVSEIKAMDVAVTLSVGERRREDYAAWKEAGADRYLLKFETSDPDLYRRLRPGCSMAQRLQCLTYLKDLDYEVGSGIMVGLPGQTLSSMADDILLMRKLQLSMVGIGPFIPHPATPLASAQAGTASLTLKVLAVTRLMLPWANLPSTTALGSVDREGRREGLLAGANVLMLNVTPLKYRRLYEIYPAKAEVEDDPTALKAAAVELVTRLGRRVSSGYGEGRKGMGIANSELRMKS